MNKVKTTGKQWAVCGIIIEMNQPLSFNSESFKYNTSVVGKTPQNNDSLMNTKVVIPLKHLSNFWRILDIPLINCEVELILTWSKNCVLADMTVNAAANPAIIAPSGATFKITHKIVCSSCYFIKRK